MAEPNFEVMAEALQFAKEQIHERLKGLQEEIRAKYPAADVPDVHFVLADSLAVLLVTEILTQQNDPLAKARLYHLVEEAWDRVRPIFELHEEWQKQQTKH